MADRGLTNPFFLVLQGLEKERLEERFLRVLKTNFNTLYR